LWNSIKELFRGTHQIKDFENVTYRKKADSAPAGSEV
jgi:hypothetical protein